MESRHIAQNGPAHHLRQELKALTGLRGLAATVVALAHFHPTLPYDLQEFFLWHDAAVDLFFCLSGFTLSYVYTGTNFQFSRYLIARIARIYPLYLVTLIIVGATYTWPVLVNPTTYPASTSLTDFVLQVLMLNAWPIIGTGVHWNMQSWSISIEWFCYILLFPLLLRLKAPRSENVKLLCVIALTAVSYGLFVRFFDERLTNPELYVAESPWSYWVNLVRGIAGFTTGWIAFSSFEQRDEIHTLCTKFSALIWLCFGAILVLLYFGLANSHALVFLFPFVVLAATDQTSATSLVLGSKALHFLGVISYSIYLMHFIVFLLFRLAFGVSRTWSIWVYAALIVATFGISVLSYFAIERPARDAVRSLQRKPTDRPARA
ncbi:acyltransferase [Bradyrhizobium sp. CCBAU 53340]|uniref:acyltransferase family protein n=1 Tax=Bradyrhizobium sp. CCBAU 53340 TaxID=1325112 RepID=UPI001FEDA9A6|nr:acyltransferase [Bradyrhizobium sp. CCBAU 53340]